MRYIFCNLPWKFWGAKPFPFPSPPSNETPAYIYVSRRAVGSEEARGRSSQILVHRLSNLILGDYALHITTRPNFRFSDLPTALLRNPLSKMGVPNFFKIFINLRHQFCICSVQYHISYPTLVLLFSRYQFKIFKNSYVCKI